MWWCERESAKSVGAKVQASGGGGRVDRGAGRRMRRIVCVICVTGCVAGTTGLMVEAAPPESSTGDDETGADELHQRDRAMKHQPAAGIATQKLNRGALDAVKD